MDKQQRLINDGYAPDVEPVLFYGHNNLNGEGSNFSAHPVVMMNPFTGRLVKYATGEHRYQAMKASVVEEHDFVNAASNPTEAKRRGRMIRLRDGWGSSYGDLCYYVMLELILEKTKAHKDVADWLKSTGIRPIYEDSPVDGIWGWRHQNDYRGKNLLGICWTEARFIILR